MIDFVRPLEVIVCWQALLVAAFCAGVTRIVKASVDAKQGRAWRAERRWFGDIVLPLVAIATGAVFACLVPLRAEMLDAYIDNKQVSDVGRYVSYAIWGGVCGQFSSYAYDRIIGIISALRPAAKSKKSDPPPPPAEITDPNE